MASEIKNLAKEVAILEKEWGGPHLLSKLDETRSISKQLADDITARQFADPLVYNELYNTKKQNKVAQKLTKSDLVRMQEVAIESLKNPHCKYHVFMNKDLRQDIQRQQHEDIRRKTLHSKWCWFRGVGEWENRRNLELEKIKGFSPVIKDFVLKKSNKLRQIYQPYSSI